MCRIDYEKKIQILMIMNGPIGQPFQTSCQMRSGYSMALSLTNNPIQQFIFSASLLDSKTSVATLHGDGLLNT